MRCRPGTLPVRGGPGSAVHRSTSFRAAPRPGHGAAAAAWPLAARAQQGESMRRIGVLMAHPKSDPEFQTYLAAFQEGLQKLGWAEGRNIQIDSRWGALDDAEARQRSGKELLALRP